MQATRRAGATADLQTSGEPGRGRRQPAGSHLQAAYLPGLRSHRQRCMRQAFVSEMAPAKELRQAVAEAAERSKAAQEGWI